MILANIEFPGTMISSQSAEEKFKINNFINSMENSIEDMAISLNFFTNSQFSPESYANDFERNRSIRSHIENEYRSNLPDANDFYVNNSYHRIEIEKKVRKEQVESGVIPISYKIRIQFIHAHSFLSAADAFSKFLSVFSKNEEFPHVKEINDQFQTAFPFLSKIRNSAQHIEDRSRGYGKPNDVKRDIKMDLKPIDNGFIKAENGGVLALSCLSGNKFGYTIDDGTYKEFEVSEMTLEIFVNFFQRIINGFPWEGFPSIHPRI